MNAYTKMGFAIALFALLMAPSPDAGAQVLPAMECNESTYGAFQLTSETAPEGTYVYFYGCTEYGWILYGTSFCDNDGNCYSD